MGTANASSFHAAARSICGEVAPGRYSSKKFMAMTRDAQKLRARRFGARVPDVGTSARARDETHDYVGHL